MDRGAWQATVHGGHKESDTTKQLNNNRDMHVCRCIEMCTHTQNRISAGFEDCFSLLPAVFRLFHFHDELKSSIGKERVSEKG